MNTDEHIDYWLKSADHDLDTAEALFYSDQIKEQYRWIKSQTKSIKS